MKTILSLFAIFVLFCASRGTSLAEEAEVGIEGGTSEAGLSADPIFADCQHWGFQQDVYRQSGQHLVCAVADPANPSKLLINIVVDSLRINGTGYGGVTMSYGKDSGDIKGFLEFLYQQIGTSNKRPASKWKLYNFEGTEVIQSVDNLAYLGGGIIYTNGNFIWPGVAIGHKITTPEGYEMETLSLKPLVLRVANFLTDNECDYIQRESEPHMHASGTSKMDHDLDKPDTTWRTSSQYFLPSDGRPIIQAIDKRTAALTKTRVSQQEYVQVLRYYEGQKYDQHHDYFDVRFYQKDPETLRNIQWGERNRLATVLWYLSTVENGGHTIFPLANGNKMGHNHDFTDCSSPGSLLVQPIKGEVIIFYSLSADGGLDVTSLHGACKVGAGSVKWASNKWVWSSPGGFLSD